MFTGDRASSAFLPSTRSTRSHGHGKMDGKASGEVGTAESPPIARSEGDPVGGASCQSHRPVVRQGRLGRGPVQGSFPRSALGDKPDLQTSRPRETTSRRP